MANVQQVVADRIAIYLGPHTAKNAVKTFSERALGRGPETLTASDVPVLLTALRPMLRTLVGAAQTEVLLEQVRQELLP